MYIIKVFLFSLFIIKRQEDVLLTASTGATAANIGGLTYHFALTLYGNQPVCLATKLRLTYKKIFIIDKVSIIGFKALIQLDDCYNAI